MHRRAYLTATATCTAALAGCSGPDSSEDAPETYQPEHEPAMLFGGPRDSWPDDLERDDSLNDNYDEVYISPDEELVVMFHVEIHDSIEAAKTELEKSRARAGNDEAYPLADEALIADDGQAGRVLFRHLNARGETLAARQSGTGIRPDRSRASRYADRFYEYWQR